jgi:hypothetical protein
MDEPQANTDSQDSPWLELEGNHHLPLYSIIYAWPWGLHPNVILSRDSQVKSPEIPKIGTLTTLETHNFLCKPLIEVRSIAKLNTLLKNFQLYVACHLQESKLGRFFCFSA